MSGKEPKQEVAQLGPAPFWVGRYYLSAMDRRNKWSSITYLYKYDWSSRSYKCFITSRELAHSYAIIIISALGTGIGLGQLLRHYGF